MTFLKVLRGAKDVAVDVISLADLPAALLTSLPATVDWQQVFSAGGQRPPAGRQREREYLCV